MRDSGRDQTAIWLRALGVSGVGVGSPGERPASLGMKALAMIAYLAENSPKPVTRDMLVDLLWERVAPAQGKGSLRQEIRRIKKALGDQAFDAAFDVTDNHIALRKGAVDYDVRRLTEAAASDNGDEIAEIMDLYGGDFLSDNSARAERFQDWATVRRENIKDAVVAALPRLGNMDVAAGRIERAQNAADLTVSLDPLHEAGHEVLLRCHIASGRRAQARAHFEKFRTLMLRELATEPSEELAALVANGEPKTMRAPRDKSRPTIAVLNVSRNDGGDQAYLSDGMVEQLVSNLSKSAWIKVAALNVGGLVPVAAEVEIAQRDLRDYADYVLRVDVRLYGDKVAVASRLSRVADGETVFASSMDDRVEDLLALQRRVALRIASIFEPLVLDDDAKRVAAEVDDGVVDLGHWRLLMRARSEFWLLRRKSNAKAQALLTEALEINPADVPTNCLMAFSHLLDAWSDWSDDFDHSLSEARRWAQKAVLLNPNDAWAQFTLGTASSTVEGLEEALSRHRQAITISPSLAVAVGDMARIELFLGDAKSAMKHANEALDLSPYDQQSGLWIRTKAFAYWMQGDLDEALRTIDYALIVRPGWFQNHYLRAVILVEKGDLAGARNALESARKLVGDYSDAALRFAHPFRDRERYRRFAGALNRAGETFSLD